MGKPLRSASQLTAEQRQLVDSSVGLAIAAAGRLDVAGLTYGERISACGLALFYAARSFKPGRKWYAHVFSWCRSILHEDQILKLDWPVHTPRHIRNRERKEERS